MSEQQHPFPFNLKYPTVHDTTTTTRTRQKYILPLILFIITVATTIIAGAIQKGIDPLQEPMRLYEGLPFSAALLTILLTHEFGHFFASKKHGVQATLPYFIPAPPPFLTGTFGAVIKTRSPIMDKKALIDIGAWGPLAGFVTSIIAAVIGLSRSEIITLQNGGESLSLGSSIIFHLLSSLVIGAVPEGQDVLLHPIAFAGWIGFFITSLNLLPIGQLDGGHIVYAVLGRWHRIISILTTITLAVLGIFTWPGWIFWAILTTFLGLRHPPLMNAYMPLDRKRQIIGWLSLAVFALTFIPLPIKM